MSNLNFDGVATKSAGFVQPGTKGVFKIAEVEVTAAKTGTPQLKVLFKNADGDSYNHWFAWTQKAAVNINHLVENATGEKLTGDTTLESVAAQLKDKKLAMKFSGKIDGKTGVGYADLSFASFGAPAGELESLNFTLSENNKIAAAQAATGSSNGADTEAKADSDEF